MGKKQENVNRAAVRRQTGPGVETDEDEDGSRKSGIGGR